MKKLFALFVVLFALLAFTGVVLAEDVVLDTKVERAITRQHPELVNDKGDLIGTPEQIVAILPGNLANICKVTEKLDLKIRKS